MSDANTCQDFGLELNIIRSAYNYKQIYNDFGLGYLKAFVGVYSDITPSGANIPAQNGCIMKTDGGERAPLVDHLTCNATFLSVLHIFRSEPVTAAQKEEHLVFSLSAPNVSAAAPLAENNSDFDLPGPTTHRRAILTSPIYRLPWVEVCRRRPVVAPRY